MGAPATVAATAAVATCTLEACYLMCLLVASLQAFRGWDLALGIDVWFGFRDLGASADSALQRLKAFECTSLDFFETRGALGPSTQTSPRAGKPVEP